MLNVRHEIQSEELYSKLVKSCTADINLNYEMINDEILRAKNKHMPCKLVKFNKYKHKKSTWITQGLLKSIRYRDKLYKQLRLSNPNSLHYYWRNVNATNNNALYTQGLIFTAHTNTSTLFAPNSPSPSVTTHLPIHLITPGNMPTFPSQSPISPRPAHIECHTNNMASSCSHLTYSVSNMFTSLHVYHTPPDY